MKLKRHAIAWGAVLALSAVAVLAPARPVEGQAGGIALHQIGRFAEPTYITGAPGFPRLLFVTERAGRVIVLRDGRRTGRPFLDISERVGDGFLEQGLLSIAFPRDYRRTGRFYVFYTDNEGDIRVDRFRRRSATRAAPNARAGVLEIPHRANDNHNGGGLEFRGEHLYVSTGDGGNAGDPPNNAQNKLSLLGKILRIDPRPRGGRPYRIPSSNPFAGPRRGRGEIFAYGLRNPYRFSFQDRGRRRDRILIADVGQSRFEELDYESLPTARGGNFGWDAWEGFARYDCGLSCPNGGTPDPGGTIKPIFAYGRSRGCTIIGGYVVRDRRLGSLFGRYIYGDYCEGELHSLVPRLAGAADDRALGLNVSSLSSFGTDRRQRLYACSLDGPVYRLVPG